MLCDNLEVGMGGMGGGGREVQEGGDMYIPIADSCWWVAETNTTLKRESESHLVISNSLWSHGLYSSWNSPGQDTGVVSHSLLQRIFQTQGSNPGLPHCKQITLQLKINWGGGFPCGLENKESACNAKDQSLILGSRRSPGEGNGYPL